MSTPSAAGDQAGRAAGPLADRCRKVDLAWLLRTGRVVDGCAGSGSIHWNRGREPVGSISYRHDMTAPECAELVLIYRQHRHGEPWQDRKRTIFLHLEPP